MRTKAQPIMDKLYDLTPRELDVARRMAQGMTNPQIARELGIGIETVKTYAANLYSKLCVSSRHDVAGAMQAQAAGELWA